MRKSMSYKKALESVVNLSEAEMDALVQELMEKLGKAKTKKKTSSFKGTRCDKLITKKASNRPNCPVCGAKADLGFIVKSGMHRGSQRYLCKCCKKKFVPTTNTAFARTRKSAETWRKFIEMTLSRKSLAECAEACDICIQTAFNWRHKIMNVFVVNQNATKMSGNVEADEMQLAISFKGNHVQGNFGNRKIVPGVINDMPREAFERGTDNKSRSSKDKACIFCMVQDGNKAFYAAVPGVGFMTEPMLNATVAKHINKENTLMLVDDYHVTRKYLEDNGYAHMILKSNVSDNPKGHKVEVKDGMHIQHANNMHSQIRRFLKPYYGVSSKYLAHYVAMFTWLKTINRTKHRQSIDEISISRAATSDCYIPASSFKNRPMIPTCA